MSSTGPTLGTTCPMYGGRQTVDPAEIVRAKIAPPSTAIHYPLGQYWINTTNGFLYYLAAISSGSAVWSLIQSTDAAFFGTGTLTSGTATIAATGVASGSAIILSRTVANASSSIGALTYGTIMAGTSFVVTSVQLASPSMTQTGDASSFIWWIVT